MDGGILSKFQGIVIKIARVNSNRAANPFIFFIILRAYARYLTSSWAIVFVALSFRLNLLSLYTMHGSTICLFECANLIEHVARPVSD